MPARTEFVIVCGGDERMTITATNVEAAKRQARRYLSRCVSTAPRLTATVCRPCGSDGQWLDEVARVTARPTSPSPKTATT